MGRSSVGFRSNQADPDGPGTLKRTQPNPSLEIDLLDVTPGTGKQRACANTLLVNYLPCAAPAAVTISRSSNAARIHR